MPLTTSIEPLDGSDLVALAQCIALDATVFPHASVPLLTGRVAPRVWVARGGERDRVVGFAATITRASRLEIAGLGVDATHRRRGVGRALLRTAVDAAIKRGLAAASLHVSTANEAALALYEGEGFHAVRLLEAFYSPLRFGNGGDAFEMMRPLRTLSARRSRS